VSLRFNQTGSFDARNGGAYQAASLIRYNAGVTYHFILDVNIASHTYSAYVMVNGVQMIIGRNFAFRTEQTTVKSLGYLGAVTTNGSHTVCNITVGVPGVAPAITTQPSSRAITAGQTASFSVATTGTAPMSYQWKKNGVSISGATSSNYTTPVTSVSDNGAQFSVAVSNTAGDAVSNQANLTVAAGTLLLNSSTSSMNFGNVTVANSSIQSVTMTNVGTANVTIAQVMVAGAGFNATGANGIILAPGQSTTLSSTFAPSASGAAAGSITVSSNATNSPARISLAGTGVAPVSHTVALNWSAAASGVTGFNAYSSTVSGGPYVKMTSTPLSSASYTDSSVQSGRTYYYVVTAVNATQESGYSSEVASIVP
jgi:hypothetical protein